MSDSRISPYCINDLKSTTDDALGNYLRSLSFKQDNSKLDTRLAFGYGGVLVCAALFVADYKLGWEATKPYTAPAVAIYMVLNGLFTYWLYIVEKGLIFEGVKGGKKIIIRSKVNKHDPTYILTVESPSATGSTDVREISTPFMTWFTADGYFVARPFQKWLATSVEVVGNADPKRASRDERDELAEPGPATHPRAAEPSSTSIDQSSGASKRSKKKA